MPEYVPPYPVDVAPVQEKIPQGDPGDMPLSQRTIVEDVSEMISTIKENSTALRIVDELASQIRWQIFLDWKVIYQIEELLTLNYSNQYKDLAYWKLKKLRDVPQSSNALADNFVLVTLKQTIERLSNVKRNVIAFAVWKIIADSATRYFTKEASSKFSREDGKASDIGEYLKCLYASGSIDSCEGLGLATYYLMSKGYFPEECPFAVCNRLLRASLHEVLQSSLRGILNLPQPGSQSGTLLEPEATNTGEIAKNDSIPNFSEETDLNILELATLLKDKHEAMIEGFIRNTSADHYLDRTYIMYLERNFFRVEGLEYYTIPKLLCTDEQLIGWQNYDLPSDEIYHFGNEDLKMLRQLIMRKESFRDETEALFVTYHLVRTSAAGYFHHIGAVEYGQLFESAETVEDHVRIFCEEMLLDCNDRRQQGLLTYYLMGKGIFTDNSPFSFINCLLKLEAAVRAKMEEIKVMNYERKLVSTPSRASQRIEDIDLMTGYEFEEFVARLFSRMGYQTTLTPKSGDQGVDVVAERNAVKIAIQAKCYQGQVDNSAIQQVTAGMKYYHCQKAVVVTNRQFTKSAIDLATRNSVLLWDRTVLKEKIQEFGNDRLTKLS